MRQQLTGLEAPAPNPHLIEVAVIPPLDLGRMLRVVWQGKWLILMAMFCTIGLAGYYAFQMTQPRYAATATLTIEPQDMALRDLSNPLPGPGTDTASLNTEVTVLTSDHILGQVVTTLDLLADPEFNRYLNDVPPFSVNALRGKARHLLSGTQETVPDAAAVFEKTIQNLRGVITVTRPRDTHILTITASSGSAQKAALIANTTAETYVATQVQARDSAAQATQTWLTGRVDELARQLAAQETAVTDLIATAQLQEETELDLLSTQVLTAEQTLAEARATLTVMHDPQSPPTARQQAEIVQLAGQVAAMEASLARLKAQLATQSTGLVLLQQMRREADATRTVYETFLARLQETRIARGLDYLDGIRIAPAASARYIGPRKVLILWLGALVGGLTGLGLVMMRAGLRRGVQDAATLRQAVGLHVLTQMPLHTSKRPKRVLAAMIDTPNSQIADAVRLMRTALLQGGPKGVPQVILSTSSLEGEGKTTHALALAQSIAGLGKSVVVIEADLRNSSFARVLQSGADHGWVDVVAGKATLPNALVQDPQLQCAVLFGQPTPARNPADLLAATGFTALLQDLRGQFDHIILDAPAVLGVPDAQIIAPCVDAIIYAVRWGRTPLATVELGLQALQDAGAPAPGLVLAQVNRKVLRKTGPVAHGGYQPAPLSV